MSKYKEEYHFLQSIGICPKCKRNRLYENEKYCPDCSEYIRKACKKSAAKRNKEDVAAYKKKLYEERKAKGICVNCGIRHAMMGKTKCFTCKEKEREKYAKNHPIKIRPVGMCLYCDNPVADGLKICEHHRQINIRNATSKNAKAHRENLRELGIIT